MKKNTIAATLIANYGFEAKADYLLASRGSWLASHEIVKVFFHGDMVTIDHYYYFWDGGDVEEEDSFVETCHLSQLWENLPEWVLKR